MQINQVLRSVLCTGVALAALGAAPAPTSDDPVARGKYLVDMGDCVACHTAPGGARLAGNRPLKTPFGTMYTPNLTPDRASGIGKLSEAQFYQIFHHGRGPGGEYLYPGFPYPWFTKVTRSDVAAIRAYLMTLPPVSDPKKPNDLMFPMNIRDVVWGWNLMFFQPGTFKPDPQKSAEVNRGAYIVEGLEHCSDCHTAKNMAQAPITSRQYAGGVLNDWYAPNITSGPEGIGGWTDQDLFTYLKYGTDPKHGVALGPMREAVQYSLSRLTDADLHAIVAYLRQTKPLESYKPQTPILISDARPGADVYQTFCSSCHMEHGQGVTGRIPALADNGAVLAQGPQDILRVVLGGVMAQGSYGPMPGFGTVLNTQQIADVANYVRTAWTNKAPGNATLGEVASTAAQTHTVLGSTASCPAPGSSPLDAAIADPANGITALMQATNADNVLQSADKIVAIVRAKMPDAPQANVVNDLTGAYCAVVAADASLVPVERWEQLNEFSQRVYTHMADHGKV